jgi:phage terminase large subunit-like protein
VADCPPRYATPRTDRDTLAGEVAAVASVLGLELLPWQRQVLDAALETLDAANVPSPARDGQMSTPAYRDVLVSVPRQSGKSSLALSLMVWRLLSEPGMRVLYGAQTRGAAREKLLSAWWPRLSRSEVGSRFKLFRGFGAETVTCDNGSTLQLLSATESTGHGETTDLCVVDEAWVQQDARIEQAVRPTMSTRAHAQLWVMSTAGTAKSVWWKKKLEAGRAAAEMGVADGLCCFDWSAHPDANPADEATWWAAMPALGALTDVATVRADLQNMGVQEFRRGYLNQWVEFVAESWQVFSEEAWKRARA